MTDKNALAQELEDALQNDRMTGKHYKLMAAAAQALRQPAPASGEVGELQNPKVWELIEAASALNIACDGIGTLRHERVRVLNALKAFKASDMLERLAVVSHETDKDKHDV